MVNPYRHNAINVGSKREETQIQPVLRRPPRQRASTAQSPAGGGSEPDPTYRRKNRPSGTAT
jgi:hypothetical protein